MSLSNAVRNLLNPSQQMCTLPDGRQVPCSAIANSSSIPQQSLPATQQPFQQAPPLGTVNTTPLTAGTCAPKFYCMNSTYYYRTSTCIDQVYQQCPAGCSPAGDTCVATSTGSGSLSAFDQIGLLTQPAPTPEPVVAPVAVTVSGQDAATLHETPPQTGTLTPTGNSYSLSPSAVQQTFTSGDLKDVPVPSSTFQELSTAQRTLAIMKETLLRALAYLRPFGRPAPQNYTYNEFGE